MIKPVVQFPSFVLMQPCAEVKVEDLKTQEFIDLCVDLRDTMASINIAVGLAANQIGVPRRVFVIKGFGLVVNPRIVTLKGKRTPLEEGCLSVPDVKGFVFRQDCVIFTHTNPSTGEEETDELRGLHAHAFQHELDHLDGKMFLDKMDFVSKEKYKGPLAEIEKKKETLFHDAFSKVPDGVTIVAISDGSPEK